MSKFSKKKKKEKKRCNAPATCTSCISPKFRDQVQFIENMNICRLAITWFTQLHSGSFRVIERERMLNVQLTSDRARRANLPFFIVKYANL